MPNLQWLGLIYIPAALGFLGVGVLWLLISTYKK